MASYQGITLEEFKKALAFYHRWPTGQYDDAAVVALERMIGELEAEEAEEE